MRIATLVVFSVVLLGSVVAMAADTVYRRCPNCQQVAYDDWWKFCPRCSAKLGEPIISRDPQDVPAVGFKVVNDTYRDAVNLFSIERPGDKWTMVTGKDLYGSDRDLALRMELAKTTVNVEVVAKALEGDDLEAFIASKVKLQENFENLKTVSSTKGTLDGNASLRKVITATARKGHEQVKIIVVATGTKKTKYLFYAYGLAADVDKYGEEIDKIVNSFLVLKPQEQK